MTTECFIHIAGAFMRQHVLPPLRTAMADGPGDDADRQPLLDFVADWIADLDAGRDVEALQPDRLALALQNVWLLGVVGVAPDHEPNAAHVDLVVRRDVTEALELAVASVRALDMLRGAEVVGAFHERRRRLVDVIGKARELGLAAPRGSA